MYMERYRYLDPKSAEVIAKVTGLSAEAIAVILKKRVE
jgi:hypothetical protein